MNAIYRGSSISEVKNQPFDSLGSTLWIPNSSYCISNSLSVELGFQILIVSGILDFRSGVNSKPRIPVSKAQISRIMQSASPYLGRLKRYRMMTLPFFSAVSSSGSSDDKASP